jgi:hypothetical protein
LQSAAPGSSIRLLIRCPVPPRADALRLRALGGISRREWTQDAAVPEYPLHAITPTGVARHLLHQARDEPHHSLHQAVVRGGAAATHAAASSGRSRL